MEQAPEEAGREVIQSTDGFALGKKSYEKGSGKQCKSDDSVKEPKSLLSPNAGPSSAPWWLSHRLSSLGTDGDSRYLDGDSKTSPPPLPPHTPYLDGVEWGGGGLFLSLLQSHFEGNPNKLLRAATFSNNFLLQTA